MLKDERDHRPDHLGRRPGDLAAWPGDEGGAPEAGDRVPGVPVVGATRLFIIAFTIAAVALLCLIVAIFGKSVPGALR